MVDAWPQISNSVLVLWLMYALYNWNIPSCCLSYHVGTSASHTKKPLGMRVVSDPLETRPTHACEIRSFCLKRCQHTDGDLAKKWVPASHLSRSLKVIGTGTVRSTTYGFLLVIHNNHGPISYSFQDERFWSKNANFFQSRVIKYPSNFIPL